MKALIIVDLNPIDQQHLQNYSKLAASSLIPFGGEFVAKGNVQALHGKADFQKKVVIQFPDQESAQGWYQSEEYQKIIPTRELAMSSQFHLILS